MGETFKRVKHRLDGGRGQSFLLESIDNINKMLTISVCYLLFVADAVWHRDSPRKNRSGNSWMIRCNRLVACNGKTMCIAKLLPMIGFRIRRPTRQ